MQNLKTKIALIASSVLMPAVSLAQTVTNPITNPPITDVGGIIAKLSSVASLFFTIIISLSILLLLYAAFLYLDARGDETKVGEAKNVVIYSVWGIGIAILAAGIPRIIASFLGITIAP